MPFDSFQYAISQAIGNLNQVVGYGNTGCEVFKGGLRNQKDFWQKINCGQLKSLNFANLCNGELSKSAKI